MLRRMGLTAVGLIAWAAASLSHAQAQVESALVPQAVALRYGMERAWFARAAVGQHRSKLDHWTLDGDRLFVQTTQNVVQGFDAETGRVLWTQQVGESFRPTAPIAASKAGVAVLNLDRLHLLDRETGRLLWTRKLESTPYTGPAMNDEWVFCPLSTGKIIAYNIKDPKKEPWSSGSGGRCEFLPIATYYGVVWVSSLGVVTASDHNQRRLQYQFEMNTPPALQPIYWPPYVVLFDKHDNMTAVNNVEGPKNGRVLWQTTLAGPLGGTPLAVDGQIYVNRADHGLYCVHGGPPAPRTEDEAAKPEAEKAEEKAAPAEGEEVAGKPVRELSFGDIVWYANGIGQTLSVGPTRIFAVDRTGGLAMIDRKTGGRQAVMPLEGFTKRLVNPWNDRVYVATPDGLIHCFHEVGLDKPVVHLLPPKVEEKKAAAVKVGDAEPKEEK